MDKSIYGREQQVLLNLLKDVRSRAKLKQVDVAQKLGRPQSFVSKYESGERRLDVLELRRVCGALGTTLGELVRELEKRLPRLR